MRCRNASVLLVAVTLALVFFSGSTAWAQKGGNGGGKGGGGNGGGGGTAYSVIELDSAVGVAYSINSTYEICGEAAEQAQYWLFDPDDESVSPIVLQHPLGLTLDKSRAVDISDNGLIVGIGWVDSQIGLVGSPLVWLDPLSDPLILPMPAGAISGGATAVNNAGVVVGAAAFDNFNIRSSLAWRVHADGTVEGPVELATGGNASAQDINENGQAVGWVNDQAQCWTLSWSGNLSLTSSVELFDPALVPYSHAQRINQSGDVCGTLNFDPSQLFDEAFLLMSSGLVPLKLLVDDGDSSTQNASANSLNDATADHGVQVVGRVDVFDLATGVLTYDPVVVWDEDQSVTDLTAFGNRKTYPARVTAITNDGSVTGSTYNERKGVNAPMLMILQ